MKYHIYNPSIDDKFKSGTYENSIQVFLGGLVGEAEKYGEVVLYGVKKPKSSCSFLQFVYSKFSRFFLFSALISLIKSIRERQYNNVFIVLGYDLVNVAQLIFLRMLGFKVLCYVFDSHRLNVKKSGVKSFWIDKYYELGFFFAGWLNAVVCVNETFPDAYGRRFNNIIKSKVGYGDRSLGISSFNECVDGSRCFNIVFGGTLNVDNGSQIVLDLARKTFPFDVRFTIYGSGPFSSDFSLLSEEMESVVFLGKVDNCNVLDVVRGADVCINLRDPESHNKNLAFPSKLVEYFFNNRFVISNDFPALDSNLKKSFVGICEFSVDSLYDELVRFYESFDSAEFDRIDEFVNGVRKIYSWEAVFAIFHEDVCRLFSKC